MDTFTSPATSRPAFGGTATRPGAPAASDGRRRARRQAATFAAIGAISTAAYVALYALLRPVAPAELANVAALVATAIGNTAANRRFTFLVRGRAGMARDHVAGLLALGVALVITSASLALLDRIAPGAPHAIEVAILVAANLAATVARFLLLRLAIDRGRSRGPRTAQPGPAKSGHPLERTVR